MTDYTEDFSAWAEECVRITDKLTGQSVPFRLNAPQRRLLAIMERQRLAARPIRILLLKARQWGGSTLVQVYMAWMQLVRHTGWNSVICAHVKDASAGIRGMYSRLLREYPMHLKTGQGRDWVLSPYEKSASVVEISARDCRIALATAGAPNSVRSANFAMAHLSEVAYWGDGDRQQAADIVRTICGSVSRTPDSVVVMESTANGRSNYFYDEWQRAVHGRSDKEPVFVPWHEIEIYRQPLPADEASWEADLDDYERALIEQGVRRDAVAWYHEKRLEYPTHEAMMAEFPSTADEAFAAAGVFDLFGEDELPPVAQTIPEGECLAVVVAATDPRRRAIQTFRLATDCLTAAETLPVGGSYPLLGARLVKWCRENDASVMVLAPDRSDMGHARWLAHYLEREDVDVCLDEDDEAVRVPDAVDVALLADRHHELTAAGAFRETDVEALACYRDSASPLLLTRLAACEWMS